MKKGEEYHKIEFGKIKQKYKEKYGEKKVYFINKNVENAKQHLIDNNIDLSFLNYYQPKSEVNRQQKPINRQQKPVMRNTMPFKSNFVFKRLH